MQTENVAAPTSNAQSTPESATSTTTDPAVLNLEQLLRKVAAGGMAPLLTKQVLDKLLEAAVAANLIQPQQRQLTGLRRSPDAHSSSLPDLSTQTEPDGNQTGSNDDEEEDTPADASSPVGDGCTPRKSNLMTGRSKNGGADSRQLSVRFDPNQVRLVVIFILRSCGRLMCFPFFSCPQVPMIEGASGGGRSPEGDTSSSSSSGGCRKTHDHHHHHPSSCSSSFSYKSASRRKQQVQQQNPNIPRSHSYSGRSCNFFFWLLNILIDRKY